MTAAGRTALDWAEYSNSSEAAAFLRAAGVARVDGGRLPELEIAEWVRKHKQRMARPGEALAA